jgi:hypothetical protein
MWFVQNMLKAGYNKVQGFLSKVPGFGWMKPAETPAFVSLKADLPPEEKVSLQEGAGGEGMNLEGPSSTRIDVASFDANSVAAIDYTNSMDAGGIDATFANIETMPDQTAAADEYMAAINKKPTAAEIAAAEKADKDELNALVAAEMKRLDLAADAEIARGGGTVVYNDTSSNSQMNNAQMVSNGLSVDATDLVAAKLNMMLPAFN